MRLYNTKTREKEEFKPLKQDEVKIYYCGPTVYNYAHIGNFRTYVFEDLLRRSLEFFGYEVEHVMNFTDVDDKTIKGAIEAKMSLEAFTEQYKQAFLEDIKSLNIKEAHHYPAATDYVEQMVKMTEDLMDKGYAYLGGDGSVYYSIAKFSPYGRLSRLPLEKLKAGASERIDSDEYDKESISDFVLWKSYDEERDGGIYWESSLGPGRPGWHIECSVMATELLGKTIDIHVGGVDNMFPHHENEIAQAEACFGCTFSNCWLHCEHLLVNNKKMSKSLGNFYTLRDLLDKGYQGKHVRLLLLQTHYQTQLNFTLEGLEGAKASLQRLQDFILRLEDIPREQTAEPVDKHLELCEEKFSKALADNLNISCALAAIFDFLREINSLIDRQALSFASAEKIKALLQRFDQVLGLLDFTSQTVPKEVEEALEKRLMARKDKDWALADEWRDFINEKGYLIEDTASGSRLKSKD